MNIPDWIETSSAEANFIVANTPSFLLRRLREDKVVYLLHESTSGDDLLQIFRDAAAHEPATMRELVTPYLCLCALFIKPDAKYLRAAAQIEAVPAYKWLPRCAQILIEEYRPTSVQQIKSFNIDNTNVQLKSNAAMNYSSLSMFNR